MLARFAGSTSADRRISTTQSVKRALRWRRVCWLLLLAVRIACAFLRRQQSAGNRHHRYVAYLPQRAPIIVVLVVTLVLVMTAIVGQLVAFASVISANAETGKETIKATMTTMVSMIVIDITN